MNYGQGTARLGHYVLDAVPLAELIEEMLASGKYHRRYYRKFFLIEMEKWVKVCQTRQIPVGISSFHYIMMKQLADGYLASINSPDTFNSRVGWFRQIVGGE